MAKLVESRCSFVSSSCKQNIERFLAYAVVRVKRNTLPLVSRLESLTKGPCPFAIIFGARSAEAAL